MPILVMLAMVVSMFGMAIPVVADYDPADSNANSINLDLILPAGEYHIGDTIYFSVVVSTPLAIPAINFYPGKNTEIVTTFTRPDGAVINFAVIPVLNRGEYVVFDYTTYPGLAYVVDAADVDPMQAGVLRAEADVLAISHCSVTGPAPGGNEYASNFREISTEITVEPCIEILKTVDCNDDGIYESEDTGSYGDTPSWKIEVHNCGDSPLHDVYVSDDYGPGWGPFNLDIDETWTVTYDHPEPIYEDTTNEAMAEGLDVFDGAVGPVYSSATNLVINPCIDVEKTVDCNDDGEFLDVDTGIAGDTGHWKVIVTNCGDVPLLDVWVWDDLYGMLEIIPEFAPGDSRTYEYDTVVNEDTTNVARADGFDELGGYWYDEDDATNLVLQPCIDILKLVDCNDDGVFLDEDTGIAGDTGHWRIVVTNCGEADLFDVMVWDTNGMVWGPFTLVAGDSVQYDYDTVVNEDTTNWAYVEGFDAAGGVWYDEDDATNLVLQPCIDIQKTVDCNDDGIFLDEDTGTAGDTGHWRIVVTNCGTADLFDVTVWDTNGMSWGPFDLPAGDSVQYDYDTIVNETTTNVAYVEGYDAAGGVWYDEDDATNVVTGGEGCTPGYWKNNAKNWEASAWVGYAPGDSFEAIFGVDVTLRGNGKATYPTPTLLEALDANGGGINALARHAVAALLNISNPDIGYGIGSTAALITMVHDAIVSGDESQIDALHILLAGYNEAGCPINQHGEPIIPDGIVV